MSELDDFLENFLPQQIAAEEALHNGDVEPPDEAVDPERPGVADGRLGPERGGWDDVGETFGWVASRFSNCSDYEFELVAAGVSGDLAYTVGFER